MSPSKEAVKLAYEAFEVEKGQNIEVIDIQGISVIADYFMISSGDSVNQVQAMADNVQEELGKAGLVQFCGRISDRKLDSFGLWRCHYPYFP